MPESIGERIRFFRQKREIQSSRLAQEIGISASAMSQIENGLRLVKAEELARIAEVLNVSPLAILDPESLIGNLPIAARTSISSGSAQGHLFKKLNFFAEIADLVSEHDSRPSRPSDMPPVSIEDDWLGSARNLAAWARKNLGDWSEGENHFDELRDAIESELYIDVVVENSSEDDVLGAAITDPRLPLLIINNNQRAQRALFTLAHELGHVLAGGGSAIVTDVDLSTSDSHERYANAFAAELLLPDELVLNVIAESDHVPDALANILKKSGVSWQTLVYRLHNLRLVNAVGRDALLSLGLTGLLFQLKDDELRTLIQQDDQQVAASIIPHWLAVAAISAYKEGAISIRPLASIIKMDPQELLNRISPPKTVQVDATDFIQIPESDPRAETDEDVFAGIPA